jgi:hypothetical protein
MDVLHPEEGTVLTGITNVFEWNGVNMLLNFTYDFWGKYYEIQGGVNNPRTSVCTAIFSDHIVSQPAENSLSWDWRRKTFLPVVIKS